MTTFLAILLVAAMIATVAALVRGVVTFLQESGERVRTGSDGPTTLQLRSNRMMQMRIFFQAVAIFIVVLILFAAGRTH